MTGWVDEGRAVDVVYLEFSKAFDTVFPREAQEMWAGWVLKVPTILNYYVGLHIFDNGVKRNNLVSK